MDHIVSQQLPFALRAFQLSRLPIKVLAHYWSKKQTKLAAVGGLALGTFALWKIGSLRAHKNYARQKPQSSRPSLDWRFLTRLYRLLRICIPKWNTWELFHMVILTLLLFSRTLLTIVLAELMGSNAQALVEGEFYKFINGVAKLALMAIPASLVNSGLKYFSNMFALLCRKRLTQVAHEKYLTNGSFSRTSYFNRRVLNDLCDQRITQDIEKFSLALANFHTSTFKPVLDVILFSRKLSSTVGIKGPLVMFVYYFVTGVLLRSVMPSFASLYQQQQELESDFRMGHSRLITHSEEIAFYGGGECEKSIMNLRFTRMFSQSQTIYRLQSLVNVVDNWLVKYGATIVGYTIVAFPVFGGADQIPLRATSSERTKDFISNSQLLVNLADSIGQLVLLYKKVLSLASFTNRVSELFEFLDSLHGSQSLAKFIDKEQNKELLRKFIAPEFVRGNSIVFEEVSVFAPDGRQLIKNFNFEAKPGSNVLISGPSGSGKSSLFRVLCGLWPLHCGRITKPSNREIFYISQRPYLPQGTLRDQVIYPLSYQQMLTDGHSDDDLQQVLETLNLVYLLKRPGGWDAIEDWETNLSTGEQQRLALTRIFFHKPRYAILDECTTSVSSDVERNLYHNAKESGITLITISHKDALRIFHDVQIIFDQDEWRLVELNKS